jgi:ATP/maltotriose-dependent transcriptional regulator MalT
VRTAFVGRKPELDIVDGLVGALDAWHGGALAIVGEPGIGKTRLLSELAERADARNYLVLAGSGSELDRDVPFWVFVDALDEYVRGLDSRLLAPLGDDVLAELASVLPGLAGVASGAPALTHERYRSHRAVRVLLERLAANQPLVLVLDDLHWADAGSWELLLALLRRPPAAAVLIAFALRPHLVPERVGHGLERAQRNGTLTRLELQALAFDEARELLEGSDAAINALYAESGGNPFYLEQLARSLGRSGSTATGRGGEQLLAGAEVPAAVVATLTEEIAGLSNEAQLVLRAAAVAGDPFEPELAAAAVPMDEEVVLASLDELLASDLVRATEVPRRFRFRHPLVRRAVYETAPGGWRLAAHERCAAALAESGAPVAAQAQHVELSAKQGDAQAVTVLSKAGEAAALRAPATAAHWFKGALRLLSDNAPPEQRVELLLAQAGALLATGRFDESRAALVESIRLVPDAALALRVRLVTKCAVVEHQLGRYTDAAARLEGALEALDDQGSPEGVGLMIELAINKLFQADFEAMNHWGGRAIAAAALLHDPALQVTALSVQAAGAAMIGASGAGLVQREQAAKVIDVLPDDDLGEHLDALVHLSLAEMYLDHYENSRRHAERAMALSQVTGQEDYLGPITAMLGTCSWVRGRLADAHEVLEGGVEAARLMDDVQGLCWTLFNLSDAASAAGNLELALETAEESWQLAKSLDSGPLPAHAGSALSLALFNNGQAGRAAELLTEAAGGEELRMIGGAWRGRYLELLTQCFLVAGKRTEAERAAVAARVCADEVGLPSAHAMADLARARLELADGDGDSAGKSALAAVAALESVGHAYGAAQARVVAGRALALAGKKEPAAAELERAAADFGSYGAPRYRAEAEQELRKLGRPVYRRSAAGTAGGGVASLTERELQLARLVVDRKTNPQIAAELFLSQKTVETHLRNIFRKVGVTSRVELARAVERADRDRG